MIHGLFSLSSILVCLHKLKWKGGDSNVRKQERYEREAGSKQATRQVRLRLHADSQEVGRSGREALFPPPGYRIFEEGGK